MDVERLIKRIDESRKEHTDDSGNPHFVAVDLALKLIRNALMDELNETKKEK